MNPTLSVIHNRKSVRKYADTPLTREEKDAILNATMRAPTAGNMMLYSIIEVEDQELKDTLAVSCDNQPFIASAPYVLLFVADYQRWMDLFHYSGAEAKCLEKNVSLRQPQEGVTCCWPAAMRSSLPKLLSSRLNQWESAHVISGISLRITKSIVICLPCRNSRSQSHCCALGIQLL